MKLSLKHLCCLLPALLLASGCSSSEYRDRSTDFAEAQAVEHALPDEIRARDAMPIPQGERSPQARLGDPPRPNPLRVREAGAPVVDLRTDEEAAWLLVERSPAEVWPGLQRFAEQQDLPVIESNPRSGHITLDADRVSNLAPQRISLRQGVRRGTSEVRLRSVAEDGELLGFSDYDLTRLSRLKNELIASLQDSDQQVSRQAQSLHSREQVRLVDRDERLVLVFRLEYDRVWSELTRLLEQEFDERHQQLEDLDRSEGRFYLRYVPRDERRTGFFARLFRRGPSADAHHYQLYLAEYNQELDLILEVEPGQAAPVAVEEELLRWLERQLR